jgi:hypothetical protein
MFLLVSKIMNLSEPQAAFTTVVGNEKMETLSKEICSKRKHKNDCNGKASFCVCMVGCQGCSSTG